MIRFHSKIRLLCLFVLGLLLFSVWTYSLPAKSKKKKTAETSGAMFRMNVNLVSVNVNVTDKAGSPVTGLTQKNFRIFDNGVLQKMSLFQVETIPGAENPVPNAPSPSSKPPASATTTRKVILFVDDFHTSLSDLKYMKTAGEQFLRARLAPTDFAALITASGRFSTEFTKDRKTVIANLNQVVPVFPPAPPDTFGAFQVEEYMTQLTLSSLQTLGRRLQAISGPKELILLSPGFVLTTRDRILLQAAIDDIIEADTLIDSVNPAGLVPDYNAESDPSYGQSVLESPLISLASGTGGTWFHNSNDLLSLMTAAIRRTSVNYILGFYPSDERYDGQFHTLVVKVDRPDVSITARKGYFAPRGEESLEAMTSGTIRNILDNSEELKDVPVWLSFSIAQEDTPESRVDVRTRIEVKPLHFRKKENRNQDTFTIVTIVYDSDNQFVDGREAHLDLNLTDQHYQEVLKAGLVWQAQFKLPTGHYTIKSAVLEAGEGKLGSAFKSLGIGE